MNDGKLLRILALMCDRLDALAAENEANAQIVAALRGAGKTLPGFEKTYDELLAKFKGLAAANKPDAGILRIRQLLAQATMGNPV